MKLRETRLYVAILVLAIALASMSGYLVAAAQQRDFRSSEPFVIVGGEGTETGQPKTLMVTGYGWASAAPDVARVSLGVLTQAATATEAVQQNAEKMSRVIGALKEMGITEDNMKTEHFSVYPVYSRSDLPEVVGYRVSNVIIVDVYDLNMVGRVIDKATEAGTNQVQGVTFTLSENKSRAVKLEALQKAAEDANIKAETIAGSLGIEIVGILHVSENTVWYQPYRVDAEYLKAPETPIIPGDVQGSATMQVTYIIQ
ncbi:MAG: SIMPL domain-containing protein [Candidatus Bathyarchaeia archaeon]